VIAAKAIVGTKVLRYMLQDLGTALLETRFIGFGILDVGMEIPTCARPHVKISWWNR
jgi:hypothetical protein